MCLCCVWFVGCASECAAHVLDRCFRIFMNIDVLLLQVHLDALFLLWTSVAPNVYISDLFRSQCLSSKCISPHVFFLNCCYRWYVSLPAFYDCCYRWSFSLPMFVIYVCVRPRAFSELLLPVICFAPSFLWFLWPVIFFAPNMFVFFVIGVFFSSQLVLFFCYRWFSIFFILYSVSTTVETHRLLLDSKPAKSIICFSPKILEIGSY